jgi:TonB family protein
MTDMALRSICLTLLLVLSASLIWGEIPSTNLIHGRGLSEWEKQLAASPARDSDYSVIPQATRTSCAANRPPEALATPDPLLDNVSSSSRIAVSFIVGADGRVHSPFILESAGSDQDRTVLQAIKAWRYRPATCNGVPTESEAKIEFSSR